MKKQEKKKKAKAAKKNSTKLGQDLLKGLREATKAEPTLIEKYRAIQKIGDAVDLPWEVMRLFSDGFTQIQVYGRDLSFGGDFESLAKHRAAIVWIAHQLGGTVKWD